MNNLRTISAGFSLLALLAIMGSAATAADNAQMDHSGHDMSGASVERDELGRRLYDTTHKVTPEMANELRTKIPLYQEFTDAQISMSMKMMGSNYTWYLSSDELRGTQGVLLLSHSSRSSDPRLKASVEGFADVFPMAMAPGMAMMMSNHIQLAVDDLKAAGAESIVVLPLVSTRHNTLLRQWRYIFGHEQDPAYATVPRVKTDVNILFAEPPGDSPWIAEILVDHALEISQNPKSELVVVAAHGPQFEADNLEVLAELNALADMISDETDFAGVIGLSMQDDAPKAVRDANVAKLRKVVSEAIDAGQRVLVVTNLMGTRSIQGKLRRDLKGLEYEFNAKGVSAHPTFTNDWMSNTIMDTLADAGQ